MCCVSNDGNLGCVSSKEFYVCYVIKQFLMYVTGHIYK